MLEALQDRQSALEARHPTWIPRRLDEQLDVTAAEFPDRPYVVTDDRTLSYAQVREESVRLARGLQAAGVQPGDHVALLLANYPEFVAMKYAIARAGAVCVPLNFLNRRDELGYVLRQSDAVVLVTMDRFRSLDYLTMLDELAPGWESAGGGTAFPKLRSVVVLPTAPGGGRAGAATVAELGATEEGFVPVAVPADTPADVLYTSGTTGQPKGVLLTHDMLLRTAYGSAYARGVRRTVGASCSRCRCTTSTGTSRACSRCCSSAARSSRSSPSTARPRCAASSGTVRRTCC